MSMFELSFLLDASPWQVAADLAGFADDLDDFKPALEKIITKVAIPSIRTNFEVGGRPAWAPLSPETLNLKSNPNPLLNTGKMYSAAQNRGAWDIGTTEATFEAGRVTDYAIFHQEGTIHMPARPFAALTPEEEDATEEEMVEWIAERLGAHDFATFTNSFGSGDF